MTIFGYILLFMLGDVTAYLPTGNMTANENWPMEGVTVACDEPNGVVVFPVIAVCDDKIGSGSDLDLYVTDGDWAWDWGRRALPILTIRKE